MKTKTATPANPDECVGFLVEPDQWDKLHAIKQQLHNGTDRERDYGHRLWLVLAQGVPLLAKELT